MDYIKQCISDRPSLFKLVFGGENAPSGTQFQTRARIAYKLPSGLTLGFDSFNRYGKVGDFGSFNQQGHQIGQLFQEKLPITRLCSVM